MAQVTHRHKRHTGTRDTWAQVTHGHRRHTDTGDTRAQETHRHRRHIAQETHGHT